jgi:hypothetical protein
MTSFTSSVENLTMNGPAASSTKLRSHSAYTLVQQHGLVFRCALISPIWSAASKISCTSCDSEGLSNTCRERGQPDAELLLYPFDVHGNISWADNSSVYLQRFIQKLSECIMYTLHLLHSNACNLAAIAVLMCTYGRAPPHPQVSWSSGPWFCRLSEFAVVMQRI